MNEQMEVEGEERENSGMNTFEWKNKNELFKAQQSQQTKLKTSKVSNSCRA